MIFFKLIILLILYSMIGWAYETILCSISAKKFVNRGFLNGPYCPIYGFGALFDVILIGWIQNPILLFFAGALVTCTLEYITSYLLELFFHARWWDYSYMKFNINGRVSLAGALIFGLFSVVLIKYIHPFIIEQSSKLSNDSTIIIGTILLAVFLFDTIYTIKKMANFNTKLKEIQCEIYNNVNTRKEKLEQAIYELNETKEEKLQEIETKLKLNYQERRWLKSFPKFRSTRYKGLATNLRQRLKEKEQEIRRNKKK